MTPRTTVGEAAFGNARPRLLGLAYRMLGSLEDAEDVVQDAALKWAGVDAREVRDPNAFLMTMVSRLAVDRLRARKRERTHYAGPWLPEPLVGPEADALGIRIEAPDAGIELADTLSLALLHVMETLSPRERAAFLMHDVFEMGYGEIAVALGREEAACRKLVSRARTAIRQSKPPVDPPAPSDQALVERFMRASVSGDMESLMGLMAPDIELISDGGGKARAAYRPLHGADDVALVLTSIAGKIEPALTLQWTRLNGMIATILKDGPQLHSATAYAIADGKVTAIYMIRNPDKLAVLARGDRIGLGDQRLGLTD